MILYSTCRPVNFLKVHFRQPSNAANNITRYLYKTVPGIFTFHYWLDFDYSSVVLTCQSSFRTIFIILISNVFYSFKTNPVSWYRTRSMYNRVVLDRVWFRYSWPHPLPPQGVSPSSSGSRWPPSAPRQPTYPSPIAIVMRIHTI